MPSSLLQIGHATSVSLLPRLGKAALDLYKFLVQIIQSLGRVWLKDLKRAKESEAAVSSSCPATIGVVS